MTLDTQRLSKKELLFSPFWIAERSVISLLNEETEGSTIEEIQASSNHIQSVSWGFMEQEEWKEVSPIVSNGLRMFYNDVHTILFSIVSPADSQNSNELDLSNSDVLVKANRWLLIKGQVRQQQLSFSEESPVDWQSLTYSFFALYELFKDRVPVKALNYQIRIHYVRAIQHLAKENLAYDAEIVIQVMRQFLDSLSELLQCQNEYRWKYYDQQPFEHRLLELQAVIASVKFEVGFAEKYGFTSTSSKLTAIINDVASYVNLLTNWIELAELKKEQLVTQLAYSESFIASLKTGHRKNTEPEIRVNPDECINRLWEALKITIDEKDQERFYSLLNGKKIAKPIVFDWSQNGFLYTFLQAHQVEHIYSNKAELSQWIVHWFRVKKGTEVAKLDYEYVYEQFRKNKKPAKNFRIPY